MQKAEQKKGSALDVQVSGKWGLYSIDPISRRGRAWAKRLLPPTPPRASNVVTEGCDCNGEVGQVEISKTYEGIPSVYLRRPEYVPSPRVPLSDSDGPLQHRPIAVIPAPGDRCDGSGKLVRHLVADLTYEQFCAGHNLIGSPDKFTTRESDFPIVGYDTWLAIRVELSPNLLRIVADPNAFEPSLARIEVQIDKRLSLICESLRYSADGRHRNLSAPFLIRYGSGFSIIIGPDVTVFPHFDGLARIRFEATVSCPGCQACC